MKLSRILSFLIVIPAISSFAADSIVTNAVPAADSGTNQPAGEGTNEVLVAKVPGDDFTNSIEMQLIKIPGGFWAGKYEVTQKQYQLLTGANPSEFIGDEQPIENISWNDAMAFCTELTARDLSKKKIPEGYRYTLPTEEEWTNLLGNATLDSAVASLNGVIRNGPNNVGSLAPNDLGLYDVRGNVMEFCLSDESQPFRFLKGGSWKDFVEVNLRPEFRWYCKPDEKTNSFGMRCLLKAK